jgi:ABC-2 type transport system ATP-binding protein
LSGIDMSETQPIVSARGLGRRFGHVWAVSSVDLDVARGEMVGVVGADGSGKTTLLQMLAAILDPSEGECRVLGRDTRREAKRIAAQLGYMTQGFTLYDRLSVDENLVLAARLHGVEMRAAFPERRERLLAMAGLEPFTARPAGALSGGMRKKLSLCTNIVHEPELLILDEPGLGVDPVSRRQLWQMLDRFRERGVSVIAATSYMDEAERCDRVLLLSSGTTLVIDTPARLREGLHGRVFEIVGPEPMQIAAELAAADPRRAIQVLPDRVRFQLAAGAGPGARGTPPGAVATEPAFEDVFVRHAADRAGAEPTAPAAAVPPRSPAGPEASNSRGALPSSFAPVPTVPATGGIEARIRSEGLTVDFGSFRAVDAVSLRVERGQLLALLGPNGAGKTTLIRALCGLVRIAAGSGSVAGVALGGNAQHLRQRIGYMSQRFSLYLDLTSAENLAFFASAYGLGGRDARARIAWACERTGIDARDRKLVSGLSGAERQRLALACSILHAPAVLFLDEPTSGVDPAARYRFWWLIRSLAASGMTILVTTHYLDEAAYCDRLALMDRGRLVATGTLAELRAALDSGPRADVEAIFVAALARAQSADRAA